MRKKNNLKWTQINPDNCSKCQFGTRLYDKNEKAHCFYPQPNTRLDEENGWVCAEFRETE